MALSKPAVAAHLKSLLTYSNGVLRHRIRLPFTNGIPIRLLAFSTPEEAADERRRRKRRLLMEPISSSLNRSQTQSPVPSTNAENPNAPKLPEPVSELSGKKLELHNKILKLIRENDLDEATLYTKHSVYSNCRPTIYTVNAVLTALFRQSKYADLLSLHRFITQAGITPNIITHNLIFQTYLDCRRPETALENYKLFLNEAPFNPAPSTYRIMIKGLIDNGMVDKAMEIKGDMIELKGFSPDPLVYHYLMTGLARNNNSEAVFEIFDEYKQKSGILGEELVKEGVLYGGLMKGYFLRGMEKEAMECYEIAVGENSNVRMSDIAYNSILDALLKNNKFETGLQLFERMMKEHNPPLKLSVNLGSFNVMVDGYCGGGSFEEAIAVFKRIEEFKCFPDVLSFNNLINHLCESGMLAEAEKIYAEMKEKNVKEDEYTLGLLMDACLKEGKTEEGAGYFSKMVELGLRPNGEVYGRLVKHLVEKGRLDEAKGYHEMMVKKLKMENERYVFIMGALFDAGRVDDVMGMVDGMLDDEAIGLDDEMREYVEGELRKVGRGGDLEKMIEEKERKKIEEREREAEAAEAAKRSARIAISSLIPSKFLKKDGDSEREEEEGEGERMQGEDLAERKD